MSEQPAIDSFAAITRRAIASDGFDGYLPTVLYPARKEVLVLEAAPEGRTLEHEAIRWATEDANGDEEFLLAFKVDGQRFKVVHRSPVGTESRVFTVRVPE